MYKRNMSLLQTLMTKIKSVFAPKSQIVEIAPVTDKSTDIPATHGTSYSETINEVVYVTTQDAQRLIKDGKNTSPSEELKNITKQAMFEQMLVEGRKTAVSDFTAEGGWSKEEAESLLGNAKNAQTIAGDIAQLNSFTDLSNNLPTQESPLRKDSKARKNTKADTDNTAKQIKENQSKRAQSIKKKNKSTVAKKKQT